MNFGGGRPITRQPGGARPPPQWMTKPARPSGNCPPGLEYLAQIDQLLCHQEIELFEAFTGWETENKYSVKNIMGQQIFYAMEESGTCERQCCSANRGFTMHLVDNYNNEVLRVNRPFKPCVCGPCCASAANCCAQEVFVESIQGGNGSIEYAADDTTPHYFAATLIGSVRQMSTACTLNFALMDAGGTPWFKVVGPCMMCTCCSNIEFPVFALNGGPAVGCITKEWSGLGKELFTDADNFGVKFPMDLSVSMKATMLAATFLIDFMAFENNEKDHQNGVY